MWERLPPLLPALQVRAGGLHPGAVDGNAVSGADCAVGACEDLERPHPGTVNPVAHVPVVALREIRGRRRLTRLSTCSVEMRAHPVRVVADGACRVAVPRPGQRRVPGDIGRLHVELHASPSRGMGFPTRSMGHYESDQSAVSAGGRRRCRQGHHGRLAHPRT